jgi:hypothetical protein
VITNSCWLEMMYLHEACLCFNEFPSCVYTYVLGKGNLGGD